MCFPGTRCYIVDGRAAAGQRGPHGQGGTGALVRQAVAIGPAGGRDPGDPGEVIAERDEAVIAAQLGRAPRGLVGVAHRCPCGLPDVAETAPRLADGSPFPTLYYLTCPRAAAAVSKLEAAGLMRDMTARLADDGLRQPLRSRASGLPRAAGSRRAGRGRRAAAARHPVGRGHARPGEVPACAGRSRARRGRREPLRPGGARRRGRLVAGRALCHGGHGRPGRRAMTSRVAAVDCGTNSLRLLLADVDPAAPS